MTGPAATLAPLDEYIQSIVHSWSRTLTALGFTLVPCFFILDYFMMPREFLTQFAVYRLACTGFVIGQYFVLRNTRPSRFSPVHGYVFSVVVSTMIARMTAQLGGFNSTYYAGLNLVMIAVMLLPWRPLHSAINSLVIIGIYLGTNLVLPSSQPVDEVVLVNNLYFLVSTAIITVSISWVKERLIRQEFHSRQDLQLARDGLWGEMAVAKRIQTSLLPKVEELRGCQVAATMAPAEEIGGDYYDVIQNDAGETWIAIGDVAGHGVESGLIMMMTQTSIFTEVRRNSGLNPSRLLETVNAVLTENMARLGADRYVTVAAMVLRDNELTFAGKHQDILVHRRATGLVESIPTEGTWLGVVGNLKGLVRDRAVRIEEGDIVLLFTDGVTEATNREGEMFGETQLRSALGRYASLELKHLVSSIARDVRQHMDTQSDDFTLLAFKPKAE